MGIIGGVLLKINMDIKELKIDYTEGAECGLTRCHKEFTVSEEMQPPIYMYYQLTNFYQSHRRYLKSRSAAQLAGKKVDDSTLTTDCYPAITNRDLGKTVSWGNVTLDPDAIASPCGLVAATMFNGKKLNESNYFMAPE